MEPFCAAFRLDLKAFSAKEVLSRYLSEYVVVYFQQVSRYLRLTYFWAAKNDKRINFSGARKHFCFVLLRL